MKKIKINNSEYTTRNEILYTALSKFRDTIVKRYQYSVDNYGVEDEVAKTYANILVAINEIIENEHISPYLTPEDYEHYLNNLYL